MQRTLALESEFGSFSYPCVTYRMGRLPSLLGNRCLLNSNLMGWGLVSRVCVERGLSEQRSADGGIALGVAGV